MIDDQLPPELAMYLQADAGFRRGSFRQFLALAGRLAEPTPELAQACLHRAVSVDLDYTSLMSIQRLLRRLKRLPSEPKRLALLGGPTTSQLAILMQLFLAADGIDVVVHEGGYGQFRQEILQPGSATDRFEPELVVLATTARDLQSVPELGVPLAERDRLLEEELQRWLALWQHASERWRCTIIQNTFDLPSWPLLGHYGLRHAGSREGFVSELNLRIARDAPSAVVLHDLTQLRASGRGWQDERFYFDAKLPCPPDALPGYAHSLAALVRGALGKSRKSVVVDLDNTLWGGVVGEVGPTALRVGPQTADGEAYLAFQHYLKGLRARGVVLAVCSKNDDAVARAAFETVPDMALRVTDFACFVANWRNKAENLEAIARELRLATDALVFIDDSPAERALVRRWLPRVAVPDLPEDPAGYVAAIARHRFFETAAFTPEDSQRGGIL